jgi:hypothetical protein
VVESGMITTHMGKYNSSIMVAVRGMPLELPLSNNSSSSYDNYTDVIKMLLTGNLRNLGQFFMKDYIPGPRSFAPPLLAFMH